MTGIPATFHADGLRLAGTFTRADAAGEAFPIPRGAISRGAQANLVGAPGGPGAFAVVAGSPEDIPRTVAGKLVLGIADRQLPRFRDAHPG